MSIAKAMLMKILTNLLLIQIACAFLEYGFSGNAMAFEHNISADSLVKPSGRAILNVPNPVVFSFTNSGSSAEMNVKLYIVIMFENGNNVYNDSAIVSTWPGNQSQTVTFRDFIPKQFGSYTCIGFSSLSSDQNIADDTVYATICCKFDYDIEAVSVYAPAKDEIILQKTLFQPVGIFRTLGCKQPQNVPVSVRIRRYSDNSIVFQSDTIIQKFYSDTESITFPSKQGDHDVSTLGVGCYKIEMISSKPDEGNRNNDTEYSQFTVAINDNVSTINQLSPNHKRFPINVPTNIVFRFINNGLSDQSNVKVAVHISNP